MGLTLSVSEAVEILKQPKFQRTARGRRRSHFKFSASSRSGWEAKGRSRLFGPYVTNGETNATLPRGKDPASITAEEANELLIKKRGGQGRVRVSS